MSEWILGMTLTLLLYSASVAGDISLADCDFEHDLCHYQQLPSTGSPHDDIDWTRYKGAGWNYFTHTGPFNDHTLGNANGFYIYTRSLWNTPNKTATLVSPAIQAESSQSCLTFWYNMWGLSMGSLEVITATPHLQNLHVVWNMTGNQGQDWKIANVTIDTSHPFEIVFNGILGPLETSDMALDDIKLTCGPCGGTCPSTNTTPPTTTTIEATTTSMSPYKGSLADCNFEQGDMCGYQQGYFSHRDTNWTLTQGQAGENSTGHSDDHTLHNGHGHYIYVDHDLTSQYGVDRAMIVSPPINGTSPQSCLTFWYSMNARNVLMVLTATPHLQHTRTEWAMYGNVSAWEMANITLNTSQPFEIGFIGIKRNDIPNYIAIDDISLTNGDCDEKGGSPADCDFEQGDLCGYTQMTSTGIVHDEMDWTLNHGHTVTANTGPDDDHTLHNGHGHYIYVESSDGSTGYMTTMYSPVINSSSSQSCLTFWYSMYGSNMGELKVFISSPHLQNIKQEWDLIGNQGQGWKMANISLDTSRPIEIIFLGVRGSGSLGDMALDDIILTNGGCALKGSVPS